MRVTHTVFPSNPFFDSRTRMIDYREEFRVVENRTEGQISSLPLFLSVRGRNGGVERWHGSRNEIPFVAQAENRRDAILEDERGCTLQGRREGGRGSNLCGNGNRI